MNENMQKALEVMTHRFGKDSLIALATVSEGKPYVRAVNSYYEDGSFYIITHALSNKMRHIEANPVVSICGDWFTGQGIGSNIGHPNAAANEEIMQKLAAAFAEWYDNGHTDEGDPNTCILRVRLTDGILFDHGTRYEIHM